MDDINGVSRWKFKSTPFLYSLRTLVESDQLKNYESLPIPKGNRFNSMFAIISHNATPNKSGTGEQKPTKRAV